MSRVFYEGGRRECPSQDWLRPHPALADYVRSYRYYEVAARNGEACPFAVSLFPMLVFSLGNRSRVFEYAQARTRILPDVIALGPCDHRVADVLDSGRRMEFKVVFQPAGFYRLFQISPCEIRNHAYDCGDVLGAEIAGLHDRLSTTSDPLEMVKVVEDVLLQKLTGATSGSCMQRAAEVLLHERGTSNLSVLASSLGLSDSSWRRHFSCAIGVSPKRYLRMLRFHRAVALKRDFPVMSWTRVCLEAGYYDQSHFIAEFREMGGSSPSEFMRALGAVPEVLTRPLYGTG